MTDPIADLLTRIRNANKMHHEKVSIPSSTLKLNILKVLKEEGFITDYKVIEDNKQNTIEVTLKYNNNEAVIKGLRRISKPGLRKYTDVDNLPKVLHGLGIAIISTSKGVMTDSEARKQKVGGEVLAYVW
ncbi:MAG: 30S ribosomal protein S8 [Acholeplasmatales bacterium]|nr:30S ribosomal protein S8 [Acholeplasmatales bacterium]